MKQKYLFGSIAAEVWRYLRLFPNSDPIMGLVLPAAKNEPFWKAPLIAFATMFLFDLFTSGIGPWTWVTSLTYALIALAFTRYLKKRETRLFSYIKLGALGVLAFDFVTGPIMSSFLFKQAFWVTVLLQIPFTIMHLISATIGIVIIVPLLDQAVAREVSKFYQSVKKEFILRSPQA